MEEVLEAVKGLTSWDAWAKLINASRASPLARSNALASFNYDEVVVMDGFLEFLTKEKDENKKCAVLSFLQENIVYFLADHRRYGWYFAITTCMEKVCSGLNQLIVSTDTSHYFRSMVLVTLTHIFLELDMLRANPAAFEAFVEILLEQASPPIAAPSTPSRTSSPLTSAAEQTLPPGARLLRMYATECLREIETAYPTLFAAQLPHFIAFAKRDATHVSYSFSLLAATVLQHAVLAQFGRDPSAPSPLLRDHESDLLPFSFPPEFMPPALTAPARVLPAQHDLTEAFLRNVLVSLSPDTVTGQTKWGACDMISLLYSIRSALGPGRDKDKLVAPILSLYCRIASPLHLHLLIRLFSASASATHSSTSPLPAVGSQAAIQITSLATNDDVAALAYMLGVCVTTAESIVESPSTRVLLAHLLPASEALLAAPSLPLASWPSAFDTVPVKLARLSAFIASLPTNDPSRYAPQLQSVLHCLEAEAKAAAHLSKPGDSTRVFFAVLEHYIRRFPSASASLFSSLASWLEIETGNAPALSSLSLIGVLLDRLKESHASVPLLSLLTDALLKLAEKSAAALVHYVPVAQRVLEEPQISPAPLLLAYSSCLAAFVASVAANANTGNTIAPIAPISPQLSPSPSANNLATPPSSSSVSSAGTPSVWATGNSLIDLCRTALLAHSVSVLVKPLGSLLLSLSTSYPDLEIRNRAGFFYRLATHVPSQAKLHQLLQLAALDEEETAGFVTSLPSGGPPDASPSSNSVLFSPASSTATPLRRGVLAGTGASVLSASPLSLILERQILAALIPSPSISQSSSPAMTSIVPSASPILSLADADGTPLVSSPSSFISDYLSFVRAFDEPPVLTLHLCLRAANSDFLPLMSGPGSPLASPRSSFSLAKDIQFTPVLPGSPAEQLNSIVVSFLPAEFYRAVPDVRVPYLSVPPPLEEDDEQISTDSLSPRPPPPPPMQFPYAFLLDLTVQPDFPMPTMLHPRASFSDGDGRSFAAISLVPLPIVFADLMLPLRLPPQWPADRAAQLFSSLWREFAGENTSYGESVKHINLAKDSALSILRSGSLGAFILPGPKLRAIVLLPPQYHLLLKFEVTDTGVLIRLRTDCWQALVFVDESLEAVFKQTLAVPLATTASASVNV